LVQPLLCFGGAVLIVSGFLLHGETPMAQQINVNLTIAPEEILTKPELAAQIALIASYWAWIEDEMTFLFAMLMQTSPVLAAAVYGRVNSVVARLDMIEAAMKLIAPPDYVKRFRKELRDKLRKASNARAQIVHSQWTTHPDYPDCLIRCGGPTDPQVSHLAFRLSDFREIQIRLLETAIALKEFAQSLARDSGFPTPSIDGWRPLAPDPGVSDDETHQEPPSNRSDEPR
jgi:hypothetical protein